MKLNLFGIPLFFILFAFVGTIFGLVSIGMQWHDFKIIQTGIKTTGIVSDYRISSDGNRAPVVKFQGPDSLLTYFSATYSSPPAYKIGEKVKIWYTPDHPENVVMSGFERWFMPIFFAVFFLIFGGIGYGGILFNYVRNREQKRLLLSGTAVQAT
ncbi:MAG: DUF3592 domain-containing protein, partial [Bacteroidetes bacterium]|nr:DUF3592 domain-containing protein [Bacteroidota bacterium]